MGKRVALFVLITALVGIPVFSQESGTTIDNSIKPELIIDVNPLMWLLSGLVDGNNNRSVYFDIGFQFYVTPDLAIKINPAVSVGFTGETAFSDTPNWFLEVQLPVGIMWFPVTRGPVFVGISLTPGYYHRFIDAGDEAFVSIGALVEVGYQFKLTNYMVLTPSIGVARVFPIAMQGGAYASPHYNLFSPWPLDSPVSPRVRLALGFWI
jgi:hypothetical protein